MAVVWSTPERIKLRTALLRRSWKSLPGGSPAAFTAEGKPEIVLETDDYWIAADAADLIERRIKRRAPEDN